MIRGMSTPVTVALVAILISLVAAAAFFTWKYVQASRRPPRPLDRLNPGEGPTRPFPSDPGDPARFRGARSYRATGKGTPEPFRRRPNE